MIAELEFYNIYRSYQSIKPKQYYYPLLQLQIEIQNNIMKNQPNKKPRIIIPQLIKKMNSKCEHNSDKQNIYTGNTYFERSRSFANHLIQQTKTINKAKQDLESNLSRNINAHRKTISYVNGCQPINITELKSKVKISNFLDQSSQDHPYPHSNSDSYHYNTLYSSNINSKAGSEESKLLEGKTTQSTDRTLQPNTESFHTISEKQQKQRDEEQEIKQIQKTISRGSIISGGLKNKDLQKLSNLLKNDKMFVNPDKWNQYLDRAVKDQEFCKALNVFLYSYFIQHYN